MNLTFTGLPVHTRMLSHQLTGHVVWFSMYLGAGNPIPRYAPICCPDLDYVIYNGPAPTSIDQFVAAMKSYQLTFFQSKNEFGMAPMIPEFAEHVKLERAKCYAIQHIHNAVDWVQEKNGLVENPIADVLLDQNEIIKIMQSQYALSTENAAKLYQFKLAEYINMHRNIKYAQIESEMAIIHAKTVDDVVEIYIKTLISLGRGRATGSKVTGLL